MVAVPLASAPFPTLVTQRLLLRQITDDDTDALFTMLSDPTVMQYHNLDLLTTAAQAHDLITRVNDRFGRGEAIRWAITRNADRRLIGTCGFTELGMHNYCGRIGYDLRRSVWGNGIMTEALGAILDYGYSELGLHRIEALVMLENSASVRTLRRLGFHAEGTLREYGHWKGRFWDLRLFSLLQPEWSRLPSKDDAR